MRAEKIGILIEKDPHGKYNLYAVGVNGDRIVASLPDLETRSVSFGAIQRRFDLVWQTLRLRLIKKAIEFAAKDDENDNNEMER